MESQIAVYSLQSFAKYRLCLLFSQQPLTQRSYSANSRLVQEILRVHASIGLSICEASHSYPEKTAVLFLPVTSSSSLSQNATSAALRLAIAAFRTIKKKCSARLTSPNVHDFSIFHSMEIKSRRDQDFHAITLRQLISMVYRMNKAANPLI